MMNKATQLAVVLALGVASRATAQGLDLTAGPAAAPSLSLTLDAAARRAVAHNPDPTVVRLKTEVQSAQVGQSRTAYTPVFSSSFGQSSNVTPPTSALLGATGVDTRDWFSSAGVRQHLPWGNGTWSVSWDA